MEDNPSSGSGSARFIVESLRSAEVNASRIPVVRTAYASAWRSWRRDMTFPMGDVTSPNSESQIARSGSAPRSVTDVKCSAAADASYSRAAKKQPRKRRHRSGDDPRADMTVPVVSELVREHGLDLLLGKIVHKRIAQDDAPGPADPGEGGIRFPRVLAQVE